MTLSQAHAQNSLSVSETKRRARERLDVLGWTDLPVGEQLKRLGVEIQKSKAMGVRTKALEDVVDAIIDIDAEPLGEDLEMAELWERKK